MQINPGGRLNTEDVVGRDAEIARYWRVLERQGLVLSAERRIGKTHILLKMRDECRAGYVPFYQDLEAVHSIPDLIRSIYATVQRSLGRLPGLKAHVAKWSALMPQKIGGVDMPNSDDTWQVLLSQAFEDLIGISEDGCILMLWDEFPLMLHNLVRRAGPDVAMQLLDHLRALRLDRADRLRFLVTGSIGLHLVMRDLRRAGDANDPVNDMLSLTVPPMAPPMTRDLATALLKETRAASARIPSLAARIADEVGGFPYYVHHVVDQLDQLGRPPALEDVSAAVDQLVYDPHDPANLRYYLNRLEIYYPAEERSLALIVLDTMAGLSSKTPLTELLNLCRHRDPSLAEERFRDVLMVLAEDHYIEPKKTAEGATYAFRWPLVQKWWKEMRS